MTWTDIARADLVEEYRQCPDGRPAALLIVGRGVHVACDERACVADAENAHRIENGAGFLPTARYRCAA